MKVKYLHFLLGQMGLWPHSCSRHIVPGNTITEVEKIGVNGEDKLLDNDSYTFFHEAGNLKITGPSGTNVNDIGIILIDK